jgi:hypothetical protein
MNPKVKKSSATKAKKIVQPIPLDITGRPVFPIVLGGLTVHSLGEVRQTFHFELFLYPITSTEIVCHTVIDLGNLESN